MRTAHASFSFWPLWEAYHHSCQFCQYSLGPEKNYALFYSSTDELPYWLQAQIQARTGLLKAFPSFSLLLHFLFFSMKYKINMKFVFNMQQYLFGLISLINYWCLLHTYNSLYFLSKFYYAIRQFLNQDYSSSVCSHDLKQMPAEYSHLDEVLLWNLFEMR